MEAQERATRPIACTLGATDFAARAERWRRLGARAALERVETPQGTRVRFRGEPGVEDDLRELVALERTCCAFADWSVAVADGEVALEISAGGEAVPVVQGMFAGLL